MENLVKKTDSTSKSTFSDLSLENVAANAPDTSKTIANVYYNGVMQASVWVQYEVTLNDSTTDEVEAYLSTHIQFADSTSLGTISSKVEKGEENSYIHDYTLGDVKQVSASTENKTSDTVNGWVNVFVRPKSQGTFELVPFIDNQADSSLEVTKKVTIEAVNFTVDSTSISFEEHEDYTTVTSKKHTDINRLWVMGYSLTNTKAQLSKIIKFPGGIRYLKDECNLYVCYMQYNNARTAGFIDDSQGVYNHIKFHDGTYEAENFDFSPTDDISASYPHRFYINGFNRLDKFVNVNAEARSKGILTAQLYEKDVMRIEGINGAGGSLVYKVNYEDGFEAVDNCGNKIRFSVDWRKSSSKDSGMDWNDHPYECMFEISNVTVLN